MNVTTYFLVRVTKMSNDGHHPFHQVILQCDDSYTDLLTITAWLLVAIYERSQLYLLQCIIKSFYVTLFCLRTFIYLCVHDTL